MIDCDISEGLHLKLLICRKLKETTISQHSLSKQPVLSVWMQMKPLVILMGVFSIQVHLYISAQAWKSSFMKRVHMYTFWKSGFADKARRLKVC